MKNISRRNLFRHLIGISLSIVFPKPAFATSYTINHTDSLVDFINKLDSKSSAQMIGAQYIKTFPEENDYSRLLNGLYRALKACENNSVVKSENIHRNILDTIKSDFGSGNIVNLHGWILSRTEARICAIAALG